jgi:hypothetical protein
MKTITHQAEFCVVGGGLAGMCAAIAAARHGVKTVLIHDRPVLGGNASSEIRMWLGGATGVKGGEARETGIMEEILLENLCRNHSPSYPVWDTILYEKVRFQENLTSLLNCSCNDLEMENPGKIKSVKAWQLTTETWHIVEAELFADCSGDSILAPLSGAEFRVGREGKSEFNESIAPEQQDKKTMGMSCLMQLRETDRPQKYTPPAWANKYLSDEDLPNRGHNLGNQNFWWLELGGEQDTIHDTESIRDELLKVAHGVWDHIKNHGDHGADNWIMDWLAFLPGKRESRRYVGEYIMNQNDVEAEGRFDDLIAYGGWSMDDHHPGGIKYPGKPTIFHHAPSPYGIPYRCLYSKNIENLFFAGRNISVTHSAMSSTRVIRTCAILGEAVGVAASIAVNNQLTPTGVYREKIKELQEELMYDDCYLPWHKRSISELTAKARLSASSGEPENLRNGIDRSLEGVDNAWCGTLNDWLEYSFESPEEISELRFILDSDLGRQTFNMPADVRLEPYDHYYVPNTLLEDFKVEFYDADNKLVKTENVSGNYQRMVKLQGNCKAKRIRFTPLKTRGCEEFKIFAWDLN